MGMEPSRNFVLGRFSHAAKTFPLPLAVSTATLYLYTYPTFFTGLEKVLLPPRSVDISETGQNRNFATGVMQLSLAVEQAANILQPGQTSRKHAVTPAFELHRCFTIARLLFQV